MLFFISELAKQKIDTTKYNGFFFYELAKQKVDTTFDTVIFFLNSQNRK